MVVDLQSLKKDIENYPNKLQAAILRERELESKVETLQEEINSLEGNNAPVLTHRSSVVAYRSSYSTVHNDPELTKMKREVERLRQRKAIEVTKNPADYGLPARPTQKVIDAVAAQDEEVEILRRKIEEREDLLHQQAEQQANMPVAQPEISFDLTSSRELERKQKELEKAEKALREVSVEREVIENALPRMYELLVRLGQIK